MWSMSASDTGGPQGLKRESPTGANLEAAAPATVTTSPDPLMPLPKGEKAGPDDDS
jgi:hypothetical protein